VASEVRPTSPLKRLVTSPRSYIVWALIVGAALYGTYFTDPYVFGFTALGLAWLSGAIALVGLGTCLLSKRSRPRDRILIVVALVVTAAAIAKALDTVSAFKWA
jgi:hypothetical protein